MSQDMLLQFSAPEDQLNSRQYITPPAWQTPVAAPAFNKTNDCEILPMRYVVVLPAKNEEATIGDAIESIANQTVAPACVLVVDDNSTDQTPDTIRSLAGQYDFLRYHPATIGSHDYELGGHVVRLFKEGKRLIDSWGIDYDWIVKLDADLTFESDFIERMQQWMRKPSYGILSGTGYYEEDRRRIYDTSPSWHTHGQFKIYNARCYAEFGGPPESLGWDCADNVEAIARGWKTMAVPDITYLMRRKVGGKTSNLRGRMNHGIGCYQLGYSHAYFLMKFFHDLFMPPYLSGAFNLMRGYVRAAIGNYPRILSYPEQRSLRRLLWCSVFVRLKNMDFVVQQKLMPKRNS